jgi:hypothetical protein
MPHVGDTKLPWVMVTARPSGPCFANLFASFVGNAVQNSHEHLHEQFYKVCFKGHCFARVILGPILCKNMKSPHLFIFLQGFQFKKDIQCKKYFAKLSYPLKYQGPLPN